MGKFQLFKDRTAKRATAPAATVQSRGAFTLNAAAFKELNEPEAVLLYFDAEDKRVGIQKAEPGEPYAFPTRPAGKGVSRLISAKTFMDTHGIGHGVTVPVRVSFEDGMAVLDVAGVMRSNDDRAK